jgi:preprotein translocase subunit SecE
VAKTADNRQDKTGKGKPAPGGKPSGGRASGGKAAGKSPNAKPARRQQQKAKAPARGGRAENRGFMRFLRDVRIELGKVTWPTRKDLIQSTVVVLVAVAIATAYTGVLDFVFSKTVDVILSVIK